MNRCIYCGKDNVALTDEHIIPLALHGEHLLEKSSCIECRDKIQKAEDLCLRVMFRPYRALVGFATRRPQHRRGLFSLDIIRPQSGPDTIKVPLDEHPASLVLCALTAPRALLALAPSTEEGFWGPVVYADVDRIRRLILKQGYAHGVGRLYFVEYARMLAKIAHGFAHAHMRNEPFYPLLEFFLPDIILGKKEDPFEYVGGTEEKLPAVDNISATENYFLTVGDYVYAIFKIRLFAYLPNSPVHTVIVARFSLQKLDRLKGADPKERK
jgi:hypothetical protein